MPAVDPAAVDLLLRDAPLTQPPIDLLFGDAEPLRLTDLVFRDGRLTSPPIDLVFNGAPVPPAGDAEATFAGLLPSLTLAALAQYSEDADATLAGALPGLTLTALGGQIYDGALAATLPAILPGLQAIYASDAARPVVGRTRHSWQYAEDAQAGVQFAHDIAIQQPFGRSAAWQRSRAQEAGANGTWQGADLLRQQNQALHQVGIRKRASTRGDYQQARRDRRAVAAGFQTGIDTRPTPTNGVYQDAIRRRTQRATSWQPGIRRIATKGSDYQAGLDLLRGFKAAAQAARPPQPGIPFVPPEPPAPDPCYVPPNGLEVHLAFLGGYPTNAALLFWCERHGGQPPQPAIVVPIRRAYIVINTATLVRASDGEPIPTFGMSLSLDADSWTWGWKASIPASARSLVEGTGSPVEVIATINGTAYRLVAESLAQERSFGDSRIAVTGRGKNAALDAPYSPIITLANTQQRTAQQLIDDALTVNGVSLGWTIDWGLTDWLVPANAWSFQGTYIEAVKEIAEAAGGYVQPHPTANTLRIRARYPTAPWDWAGLEPDLILPADVVQQESIEWIKKADYNRVYVAGQRGGILGQVTRTGTAGDLLAPMVVDQLITHADAARQRGLSILADTGAQTMVGLRLPVLAETGIIEPGKFVRYNDGTTDRLGIVRSVNVDANFPEIWQNIEVQSHA